MRIQFIQDIIDFIRMKKNKFHNLQSHNNKNLRKIRHKAKRHKKITVVILAYASAPSVDNFSRFYHLLAADSLFDVHMVVAPYTHDSIEAMLARIKLAEDFLTDHNIPYILGYNHSTGNFFNSGEQLKPDLVFAETNYDWSHKYFLPESFPNSLFYYIPYSPYLADNMEHHFQQKVMVQAYKLFPTIRSDLRLFKEYSPINGKNVYDGVLGSLKLEPLFDADYVHNNVWKKTEKVLKKLIWAPHHTWAWYGQFVHYKDFMLDIAQSYKDALQISFKPHPALKESLCAVNGWQQKEITAYYDAWSKLENAQLEDGEWIDLFMGSDAMLLDSISFMAEYSATGKPACFIGEYNSDIKPRFNKEGEKVYDILYHANNEDEIIKFIEDVLLNGNDHLALDRSQYIEAELHSDNGKLASTNFFDYIKKTITL